MQKVRNAARRFLYAVSAAMLIYGVYLFIKGVYFDGMLGIIGGPMLYYGTKLKSTS